MPNRISRSQNTDDNLNLLRARGNLYQWAKLLFLAEVLFAVFLPAVAWLASNYDPTLRSFFAFGTLIWVLLDVALIEPILRKLVKSAAVAAEEFDCSVLEMSWDSFVVGEKLDPESVARGARSRFRTPDTKLRDWYGAIPREVPIHIARIICQRTNLQYDRRVRSKYRSMVLTISLLVVALIFLWALKTNSPFAEVVLFATPFFPLVIWGVREYRRHLEIGVFLEKLFGQASKLWCDALSGTSSDIDVSARSRELQTAIYLRRASGPLVLPGVYRFLRYSLELDGRMAVEKLVSEYKSLAKHSLTKT